MQKRKHDLFLDFDSTMVNSTKRLVEILNEQFGKKEDWEELRQYDGQDLFPEATRQDVIAVFDKEEFFEGLEIFDGCLDVVKKYKDYFNIKIATIGTKQNLYYKKIFCNLNFDFDYEFLGIEKDGMGKHMIDMSDGILIDDHVDNIRTSNAKVRILFKNGIDTDWNKVEYDDPLYKQIDILDDWCDVDATLNFIIRIGLLEE